MQWYLSDVAGGNDWSIQCSEGQYYVWCWLGDIFDLFYINDRAGIRCGDRVDDTLPCPCNWILA